MNIHLQKSQSKLKGSYIQTSSPIPNNPPPSQPKIIRKSFGDEHLNSTHHTRYQSTNNLTASHLSQGKNDSYVSITQTRPRDISRELTHPNLIQKKINEISVKMEGIWNAIEKHEKQLSILSKREGNEDNSECIKKLIGEIIGERDRHYTLQNKIFKTDLDTLKVELKTLVEKKQLEKRVNTIQTNMRDNIWNIKNTIHDEIRELEKRQGEGRKKDYEILTGEIEAEMKTVKSNFQQMQAKYKSEGKVRNILKANQKNSLLSFLFKVESKILSVNGQDKKEFLTKQTIYKIDNEGFLLDEENRYILDERNEHIHLSNSQIELLKTYKMIP